MTKVVTGGMFSRCQYKYHKFTLLLFALTVLPAKSDSNVMFCLQSYQGLRIDRSLCINPIHRIG